MWVGPLWFVRRGFQDDCSAGDGDSVEGVELPSLPGCNADSSGTTLLWVCEDAPSGYTRPHPVRISQSDYTAVKDVLDAAQCARERNGMVDVNRRSVLVRSKLQPQVFLSKSF